MRDDDTKSKSWKDKLEGLLFEEDMSQQTASESAEVPVTAPEPPPAVPAALPDASSGLDLAVIYREAGINDEPFATPEQVLELQSTFADLPAEVQRQKVLKTLASFKVDAAHVAANTRQKMQAVENYIRSIRTDGTTTIDTSNQTIEEMQKQIDACKQRIMETQSLLDKVSREGQGAVRKLQGVLDFLGVAAPAAEPPSPQRRKDR